jgi:aryl-alcohol dehydrogenase-like predicted oxidoreductase
MKSKGIGIIAKRPIAGAVWRFTGKPESFAESHYWHRFHAMHLNPHGMDWNELALRFTLQLEGVSSAITGTSKISHFRENIRIAEKGPLPEPVFREIREAFIKNDDNWTGLI